MSDKFSLLGYPLKHTMSPPIHKRLFELSGRKEGNYEYFLTEIPPESLADAYENTLKKLVGYNITIPYKVDIIPYLTRLDESAAKYRSVNCVRNRDGEAVGFNTDCKGFLRSVTEEGGSLSGRVLQAGCGGVGRMMAIEAVCSGADLTVCVRKGSEDKVRPVIEYREAHLGDENVARSSITVVHEDEISGHFDLLMNSTSVGMFPNVDACPVPDEAIKNSDMVFDVIYNPRDTLLIKKAAEYGKKTVGGMAMLVWQAVVSHEIWNGCKFAYEDIAKLISDMEELMKK